MEESFEERFDRLCVNNNDHIIFDDGNVDKLFELLTGKKPTSDKNAENKEIFSKEEMDAIRAKWDRICQEKMKELQEQQK